MALPISALVAIKTGIWIFFFFLVSKFLVKIHESPKKVIDSERKEKFTEVPWGICNKLFVVFAISAQALQKLRRGAEV